MPKCENCGREFDGNFCPSCGTGAEASAVCPHCKGAIKPDARFCAHCGKPVSDTGAAESAKRTIKNETKIDPEYNLRVTENMAGRRCRLCFWIAAGALLALGAAMLALEYLLPGGEEPDISSATVCLVLGALFGVFALAFKPFMKTLLKKNMQGKESTNIYTFTEEGYEVLTRLNDGTESTASGNYFGFTEAKEYKDMWLLYINKATVFSVSKAGMTEGTAEELSALLARVTGERYKVRYKK